MLVAEPYTFARLARSSRQACVVDARLALSKLGMVTLARLCAACTVWLPTELREVLRHARRHLASPDQLVPRVLCGALRNLDRETEMKAIGWELAQWERLPANDDLASLPFFYLGDRADECAVPLNVDRGLRSRYEQLHVGLHLLMERARYDWPRGRTVAWCTRDTVALSAALQPYGAFVLTRLEPDGEGAPALCDYLEAWGIGVTEIPQGGGVAAAPIHDVLARARLGAISWAGIQLAAVHVVVAGLPVLGDADAGLDSAAVADLWSRSTVFWHRIWS